MASDEDLGLALWTSCVDTTPDGASEWSGLPPELLEMIGSKLTEGAHLHNAALVCKTWSASIPTGLTGLEVDMHADPGVWRSKLARLQSLVRHLRAVVIHVNAAISEALLVSNVALVSQLSTVTELKLHLREGCDLPPAAAAAIGAMSHLTTLSIVGGGLKPDAAAGLLTGLAAAAAAGPGGGAAAGAGDAGGGGGGGAGGLRSLTLLPSVPSGLGDGEMERLAAVSSLEVLEFRAYRLTSAGLATLSLGLPRLTRLAISALDSDSGYELACLERLAALKDLDLALEAAPTAAASRAALCAALGRPGRSLSLSFRWTDKAQGLLTEYGNRLANLTHLDVGACRVGSASLFEAVAQLTGLRELRMAVYSNADHAIPCHLSRLSALAALQRFHLEKRKAYFPEARRFGESSIAVPVTAEGLRSLAGRWTRLRSLRLALSRKDYSPEALSVLASFTGLRDLGIVVERGNAAAAAAAAVPSAASPGGAGAIAEPLSRDGAAAAASGTASGNTASGSTASGGVSASGSAASGRLLLRRSVELPPLLDLSCLPPGLQSLELNNLLLELSADRHPREEQQQQQHPNQQQRDEPMAEAGAADEAVAAAEAPAPASGLAPVGGLGLGLGSPRAASVLGARTATTLPAPPFAAAMPPPPPPPSTLPSPPPPPLPLSALTSLDIEACVVRPPLLSAMADRCGGSLRCLRLVGVVGLCDAVLADCLPALRALRSLTVSAPGNRAVTQASLAALSTPAAAFPSPSPVPFAAAVAIDPATADDGAGVSAGLPWRQQPWPPQRLRRPTSASAPLAQSQLPPPLVRLRQLSWESDDLTARGPDLRSLAPLTALRHLYLSCTDKTAERALGSLRVLQDALPYCHVDMVWTAARPGGEAQ